MSQELASGTSLHKLFTRLVYVTTVTALCVTSLGAYVRLSDAGLGCPDWPGCYGKLIGVPKTSAEIERAAQNYPDSQISPHKAWKEVLHRYLAGILSVFILLITGLAFVYRNSFSPSLAIPLSITGLTILQIILGMWTVTMLLKPLVVSAHLLCGLLILSLLWRLAMPTRWRGIASSGFIHKRRWHRMAQISLAVLIVQIASGAWTSSNYAALACTDFPTCQQQWLPTMDFAGAFLSDELPDGTNYEYGVLDNTARTTIHMTHRVGALLTLLLLSIFLLALLSNRPPAPLALAAKTALAFLAMQILLGVLNVVLSLPLVIATAHTTMAAMLLLSLIAIAYMLKS